MNKALPKKRAFTVTSEWLQASTETDPLVVTERIMSCADVLSVLSNILIERHREASTTREVDYTNSAWPYLEAHRKGRIEELEKIIRILPTND